MCEQSAYYLKEYADRLTLTIVSSSAEDHIGISDGETEHAYQSQRGKQLSGSQMLIKFQKLFLRLIPTGGDETPGW